MQLCCTFLWFNWRHPTSLWVWSAVGNWKCNRFTFTTKLLLTAALTADGDHCTPIFNCDLYLTNVRICEEMNDGDGCPRRGWCKWTDDRYVDWLWSELVPGPSSRWVVLREVPIDGDYLELETSGQLWSSLEKEAKQVLTDKVMNWWKYWCTYWMRIWARWWQCFTVWLESYKAGIIL